MAHRDFTNDWKLVSNAARANFDQDVGSSATARKLAYRNLGSGCTDVYAQILSGTIVDDGVKATNLGAVVRLEDADNYYTIDITYYYDANRTYRQINKVVANSESTLSGLSYVTGNASHKIKATADGTSIKMYLDDANILSVTDGDHTGTYAGMRYQVLGSYYDAGKTAYVTADGFSTGVWSNP